MADGNLQPKAPKVVWRPLPGSQELAMSCPCNHILYEGTRGPGKTDAQLMKFRRYVGLGYGRHWRGVIFDREYKNLDDLVSKSMRWFPEFKDGARFLSSKSDYRWVWPTGEELLFRQVKRVTDYWGYHGQEFPFIGWNELTKYPNPELFDMLMSCNRTSYLPEENPIYLDDSGKPHFLPEIPLIVFATTNPFGAGHNWVKRRFIDPAAPGQILRKVTNVFNPRTQRREDIVKTQVRLFGSYKENRYLSPEYVAELEGMRNQNRRRAWLWGDWDIVAGGAIDDLWDEVFHIAPRFRIPKGWYVDRSFDWGSTKPFSIGWWAEANGEEVKLEDGTTWCPPPGTLFRIAEIYGTEELGSNKGVQWGTAKIAEAIHKMEAHLKGDKWVKGTINPGPADSSIFDKTPDNDSIAKIFSDNGVEWERADKTPGSRKLGLQILRDRLQASLDSEGPGIYFMRETCPATLALLPVVPRDEIDQDDVDTESEDHLYDDVRYRCLKGNNRAATDFDVQFPT